MKAIAFALTAMFLLNSTMGWAGERPQVPPVESATRFDGELPSNPVHTSAKVAYIFRIKVTATAYNAADGYEWCHRVSGRRVCGDVVRAGGRPWVGTLAVSHDLLTRLPMGSCVRWQGWRYRTRDTMGAQATVAVDFYAPTVAYAKRFGRRAATLEVIPCGNPVV